ncbi:MAG: 1-deoxy-D-xylulose-5-phosphate reductoisomerase, partial [Verrucomicrobiales bacterium]
MSRARNVVILGSTGSIGQSALKVARDLPGAMNVVGLAAHRRAAELAAQVRETGVRHAALGDGDCVAPFREALGGAGEAVSIGGGEQALV